MDQALILKSRLILVRHGETDWAREGKIQGHANIGLNETGMGQAAILAKQLRTIPVDCIYSSDLPRALQTAQIISADLKIAITSSAFLRERDYGWLQGKTWLEAYLGEPRGPEKIGRNDSDSYPSSGESPEEFSSRIINQVNLITSENRGRVCLIVTHAGALDVVMRQSLNVPPLTSRSIRIGFCKPFLFDCDATGWRLICGGENGRCQALDASCLLHRYFEG